MSGGVLGHVLDVSQGLYGGIRGVLEEKSQVRCCCVLSGGARPCWWVYRVVLGERGCVPFLYVPWHGVCYEGLYKVRGQSGIRCSISLERVVYDVEGSLLRAQLLQEGLVARRHLSRGVDVYRFISRHPHGGKPPLSVTDE